MATINLQLEVTKFMSARMSKNEPPFTLFGDQTERIKIAAKVVLAGKTVKEGFPLGFKIIQVHVVDSSISRLNLTERISVQ